MRRTSSTTGVNLGKDTLRIRKRTEIETMLEYYEFGMNSHEAEI